MREENKGKKRAMIITAGLIVAVLALVIVFIFFAPEAVGR